MESIANREAWLTEAVERLWPRITRYGGTRAKVRASCGWPSTRALARSNGSRRIGECWSDGSDDGTREIFITPAEADPVRVLDVLLHELIHAALPKGTGHKAPFARLAKAVGLEGKPTATNAGPALERELRELAEALGPYPHARLDRTSWSKQTTRQLKVWCDCGYIARTTRTQLDERGAPICPVCMVAMREDSDEPGGEPLVSDDTFQGYRTRDGRFEVRYARHGRKPGEWTVLDMEAGRRTHAGSKQDALDTIAAIREGLFEWPELAPSIGDDDELTFNEAAYEDFLGPDEWEDADNPADTRDPEHRDVYPTIVYAEPELTVDGCKFMLHELELALALS